MDYDILIIGSGPGGYVAAIRAAQLGLNVAVVEKAELGGICLNWGCIPTKALLKSAEVWHLLGESKAFGIAVENPYFDYSQVVRRSREVAQRLSKGVEFLFKKNRIVLLPGTARFTDKNTLAVEDSTGKTKNITAQNMIIATGARPRALNAIPIDGQYVISSREALSLETLPRSVIVIGAGAIGVEFAYLWRTFGVEVTLVELLPQILPNEDEEIARELTRALKKAGINIYTGAHVENATRHDGEVEVSLTVGNEIKKLAAERALMAVGVQPNTENLGLEACGIITDRGWIKVDEHYRTNVAGVYAIGDVIGNPCLAHVASAEGVHAVEFIAGKNPPPLNYTAVPGCTYCQPQVASVGLTERQAVERGLKVRIGRFPFRANGKSMVSGESEGQVKVLFEAESGIIMGGHIIGSEATELLPELVLAVTNRLTFADLKNAVHAHPTLSEALSEALHDAFGEAIHR